MVVCDPGRKLDALRDGPAKLLGPIKCVLGSGDEQKVFEVVESPALEFRLASGQYLGGTLDALYRNQQIADLFGFTGAAMHRELQVHPRCAPRSLGSMRMISRWTSVRKIWGLCSRTWNQSKIPSRAAS